MFSGYQGNFVPASPVAIASGQTTSAAIPLQGYSLVGIQMPAAFTGATVSFMVCATLAGTYLPLYNAAGLVSYSVTQGRFQAIDPKDFQGVAFLKIVSASSEGAARSFTCALKG